MKKLIFALAICLLCFQSEARIMTVVIGGSSTASTGSSFSITDSFSNLDGWTLTSGTSPSISGGQVVNSSVAFSLQNNTSLVNSYREYAKIQVVSIGSSDEGMAIYLRGASTTSAGYIVRIRTSNGYVYWSSYRTDSWEDQSAISNSLSDLGTISGKWVGVEIYGTGNDTVLNFWIWDSDPGEKSSWGAATWTSSTDPTMPRDSGTKVAFSAFAVSATLDNFSAGSTSD